MVERCTLTRFGERWISNSTWQFDRVSCRLSENSGFWKSRRCFLDESAPSGRHAVRWAKDFGQFDGKVRLKPEKFTPGAHLENPF
jgi:hypothetical protein